MCAPAHPGGPIAGREQFSGRAGSFANRKCVDLRR